MNARRQLVTNANGEKVAVILPIAEHGTSFNDLPDLTTVTKIKDDPTDTLGNLEG